MTINTEAIDYATNKVNEIKLVRVIDENLLFELAVNFFVARSDSQEAAERAAKEMDDCIESCELLKRVGFLNG